LKAVKILANTALGGRDLCAWQVVRGLTWVQTRNPKHARRLAKRRDGRLVVRGMAGAYLKTFEFERPLSWAARLMKRYLSAEMASNAALNGGICPPAKPSYRPDRGQRAESRSQPGASYEA
jgi:hypothetical protein